MVDWIREFLKKSTKKEHIIFMTSSASLFVFTFILLLFIILNQKVYSGIKVQKNDVSHLSLSELKSKVSSEYESDNNRSIEIKLLDSKEIINVKDFNIKYDTNKIVDSVFEVGRKGNLFFRLSQIVNSNFSGTKVSAVLDFDKNLLEEKLEQINLKIFKETKEHRVIEENNEVKIVSGQIGQSIDKKFLEESILKAISKGDYSPIQAKINTSTPKKAELENLYKMIYKDAKDANYNKYSEEFAVVKEEDGRDCSKDKLSEIVTKLDSAENSEYLIEIIPIKPKKTEQMLKDELFKDVVGGYSTVFPRTNSIEVRRSNNIQTAANYINGKVIMPEKEFSFNNTVGKRTPERGFQTAFVYTTTGMELDAGGGICQVVSTLHLATIDAGLVVTERNPHKYIVTYVPLGFDAAVFWDANQDFKFKNNTGSPVQIISSIVGTTLRFEIKGINKNPEKKYKLEAVRTGGPYPFSIVETTNPIELHKGMYGYSYNTYRVTTENGVEIDRKLEFQTSYQPYPEKIMAKPKPTVNPATDPAVNPTTNPNTNQTVNPAVNSTTQESSQKPQ